MPPLPHPQAFALALAHHQAGRLAEAETIYRQILAAEPHHSDALHLLGVIAHQLDRHELAVEMIRQAIGIDPVHPAYHDNLGSALRALGRLDEAIACSHRALALRPDDPETYSNLGNALREQGRVDEAIAAYRRALELRPDYAAAQNNLGLALRDRGDLAGAIAAYRQALQLQPSYPDALNNLGVALHGQGEFDAAIASYQHALRLQPDCAEAHTNLGVTLHHRGEFAAAIAAYRRALECQPDDAQAHCNLLLILHYPDDLDPAAIFAEHCRWDEAHARPLAPGLAAHANLPDPERRLRVGYVSPDFREHAVASFFENLLAAHDRDRVEVFCYDDVRAEDAVTLRLQKHAACWRKIRGVSDAQVAELIREDRIDILVDLAGHTSRHRLLVFARQPAPVQVTYLGYCDTTGMKAMDYRLTDALADPPGATEHLHSEQLIRLPASAWCFRPPADAPPVNALPLHRAGHLTFGCFNGLPKLNPATLILWSRILLAVPGSRLLLKNVGLREPSVQSRIRGVLEHAGIAAERITLLGPAPNIAEHLAAYGRVDIALDTFPYHGTTTTCEALWMGVPVVTLAGPTHESRVGVSLLTNAGLPELIARDRDEYSRLAVQLAADVTRLADLRATLRARLAASPLLDAPRFARNVEAAYRAMWRQWCVERSTT